MLPFYVKEILYIVHKNNVNIGISSRWSQYIGSPYTVCEQNN